MNGYRILKKFKSLKIKRKPAYQKNCLSCFYHVSWFMRGFPIETCKEANYCGYPEVNQGICNTDNAVNCEYFTWMDNNLIKIVNGEKKAGLVYPTWWENKHSFKYKTH